MKAIHAIVLEDFGKVDRSLIRMRLLAENGIHQVDCDTTPNGLRIEYDPAQLPADKLNELMCRCGVYIMGTPCKHQEP